MTTNKKESQMTDNYQHQREENEGQVGVGGPGAELHEGKPETQVKPKTQNQWTKYINKNTHKRHGSWQICPIPFSFKTKK